MSAFSKFKSGQLQSVRINKARAAERVRHTCLAWIEGESGAAAQGLARTVDLSPLGVGLVLAVRMPEGARVVVELLLPGSLRLRATGEVAHSVPLDDGQFRVGVRFFSPPILAEAAAKESK